MNFDIAVIPLKLPSVPMSPIAGPTLLRHDTEAYNALEPSIPESTVNDVERHRSSM